MLLVAMVTVMSHDVIRCSDGIDRHRQEWIDNGCSDNVCGRLVINVLINCNYPIPPR